MATWVASPQTRISEVDAHVTSTTRGEITPLIIASVFVRELENFRAVLLRVRNKFPLVQILLFVVMHLIL